MYLNNSHFIMHNSQYMCVFAICRWLERALQFDRLRDLVFNAPHIQFSEAVFIELLFRFIANLNKHSRVFFKCNVIYVIKHSICCTWPQWNIPFFTTKNAHYSIWNSNASCSEHDLNLNRLRALSLSLALSFLRKRTRCIHI